MGRPCGGCGVIHASQAVPVNLKWLLLGRLRDVIEELDHVAVGVGDLEGREARFLPPLDPLMLSP